jgi:hypothetical protein
MKRSASRASTPCENLPGSRRQNLIEIKLLLHGTATELTFGLRSLNCGDECVKA